MVSAITKIIQEFDGKPEDHLLSLSTKEFFKNVSTNRLLRICKHPDISLNGEALVLTKETVRKIFVGLADISIEDVRELSGPLHERIAQLIPYANYAEYAKTLLGKALPAEHFATDFPSLAGNGLKRLMERVSVQMLHHFKIDYPESQLAKMMRDAEMLTSRLADREIQEGSVIHLCDGFYYAAKNFCAGGAYASILRPIEGNAAAKIVFRGTAFHQYATGGTLSAINDILLDIGSKGIKSIWPELKNYIDTEEITAVEVLGKSLGGAMAQMLTILLEGLTKAQVTKLITFAAVGVGDEINALFAREILTKRKRAFAIDVLRLQSDAVPTLGGVHLGAGIARKLCETNVYYLQTEEPQEPSPGSIYQQLKLLSTSLNSFHCRQATIDAVRFRQIDDVRELEQELRIGTQLETVRKYVAYTFHYLTLTLYNGQSFTEYYEDLKKA